MKKSIGFGHSDSDTVLEDAIKRWEQMPQRQQSLAGIMLEKSRQRAPERDI